MTKPIELDVVPVEQEPVALNVDAATDLIAEALKGTYHCNRVWTAWGVGTMSEDDFSPVEESDTPREIAEAIFEKFSHPAPDQSAEIAKLIQAVADHVTVRAEQYQQIQELQAELATAAVTDDRAIADTVNDLRIVAINFHAAEQLRARIADVIVPGLKRIQKLEELNDKRLGEIRTTLKLLAEARGDRDALRAQVRVLSEAGQRSLNWLSSYPGGCAENCYRQMSAALAAVREPADHIEHDLEMVPAPACWQPIESAPRQTELLVGRYVHHRCRKSAD